MGNQLPAGVIQYKYPLQNPPLPLAWPQYVSDCGIRSVRLSPSTWNLNFKGHVVQWTGLLTFKSNVEAKFLMNPTECKMSNNEVTLDIPPKFLPQTFSWVQNSLLTFKGRIKKQGNTLNHHLEIVDPAEPFEPALDWNTYVFHCGSGAQEAHHKRWNQFYHNQVVSWHAKILTMTQMTKKTSDPTSAAPALDVELQMVPPSEDTVHLIVPVSLLAGFTPIARNVQACGDYLHFHATMADRQVTANSTRTELRFLSFCAPSEGDQSYLMMPMGAQNMAMMQAYQAGIQAGAAAVMGMSPSAPTGPMAPQMQMQASPQMQMAPQMQVPMTTTSPGMTLTPTYAAPVATTAPGLYPSLPTAPPAPATTAPAPSAGMQITMGTGASQGPSGVMMTPAGMQIQMPGLHVVLPSSAPQQQQQPMK